MIEKEFSIKGIYLLVTIAFLYTKERMLEQ